MGRGLAPMLDDARGGESGFFIQFNRNKKSITLNLKNEKALEMFYGLVKSADVIVENYKGGVTKRLKIDYETLKTINPNIIFASSSGFGQNSPLSHRPAFDIFAQAMGGIINLTGFPDQEPVKVGPSVADHLTGLYVATGVILALFHRARTRQGQHVDVSMVDSIFSVLESAIPMYTMMNEECTRNGNIDMTIAPFDIYHCKDGYVAIGVGSNIPYTRLCEAIGRPDLITDPRFATNILHVQNYQLGLQEAINNWCLTHTKKEIEDIMDKANVPCGPLYTMKEAIESPHIKAREMLVHCQHPTAGDVLIQNCVIKLSETPGSVDFPSPLVGQHNCEVLGLTEDQILQYKADGVM